MVRELVHDPILLSRVSEPAGKEDWAVAQDLLERIDIPQVLTLSEKEG